MALIVETGTGLPDAESYASVAQADAYHADRGGSAWGPLSVPQKEAALRRATDYLQQNGGRWQGYRVSAAQALDWPRSGVVVDRMPVPADSIPVQLVRACCELALKATTQALAADEAAQVKSEKVGQIEVVYADGARQQTRFAAVEAMLRPLQASSGNTIALVRA